MTAKPMRPMSPLKLRLVTVREHGELEGGRIHGRRHCGVVVGKGGGWW